MSHRIEYLTNDGGTIIEYTDETRFNTLVAEANTGLIEIVNSSRYDITSC